MTYFMLYLLTCVGKISALLKIGGMFFWFAVNAVGLIVFVCAMIASGGHSTLEEIKDKAMKMFYKPIKFVLIAGGLSYSIGALLPTERDMAIIIGGGITYEALTSDTGKEIGGKAVELLLKKIDESLAEPLIEATQEKHGDTL